MKRVVWTSTVWSLIAAAWYFLPTEGGLASGCFSSCIASSYFSVPEPTTLSLLATGAAATLFIFRRRK